MRENPISSAKDWLELAPLDGDGIFRHKFDDRHLGNIFIRSIHGGVSASITELCAELSVKQQIGDEVECLVTNNCMNYLRATKDQDIFAKAEIIRISKRAAFVDVTCWQDDEQEPVTKATCTLQLFR